MIVLHYHYIIKEGKEENFLCDKDHLEVINEQSSHCTALDSVNKTVQNSSDRISILAVVLDWYVFDRCVSVAVAGGSVCESFTERTHFGPAHGTVGNLRVLAGTPVCTAADRAALRRWSVLPV